MKILDILLIVALLSGCSRPSQEGKTRQTTRTVAATQARSAVTETETAVLAKRVHALEVEVANMQLLEDRMKALELKVYAQPGPDGSTAAPKPAVEATPVRKSRKSAVKSRDPVNPFLYLSASYVG